MSKESTEKLSKEIEGLVGWIDGEIEWRKEGIERSCNNDDADKEFMDAVLPDMRKFQQIKQLLQSVKPKVSRDELLEFLWDYQADIRGLDDLIELLKERGVEIEDE